MSFSSSGREIIIELRYQQKRIQSISMYGNCNYQILVVRVLNFHRDKKIVVREPGRDGNILRDHRQDGNDEVHWR